MTDDWLPELEPETGAVTALTQESGPIVADDLLEDLTCLWFEHCDRPAAGMAGHSVQGVIPVCGPCAQTFAIPLINKTKIESE